MNDLLNCFKLLSDETRLRILVLLYHKKLCVCQLTGIMGVSQPKVSKHLAKLRDLGFVKDERSEQFIYYELHQHKILKDILNLIIASIKEYPILVKDIKQVENADVFLTKCDKKG